MYCKNCGCKLASGKNVCPECGADSADIEFCGGFWGLVGQSEPKAAQPKAPQPKAAQPNNNNPAAPGRSASAGGPVPPQQAPYAETPRMNAPQQLRQPAMQQTPPPPAPLPKNSMDPKNSRKWIIALSATTAVFFVASVVLGFSMMSAKKQCTYYETNFESAGAENQALTAEIETKTQDYDDLQNRYDTLAEEKEDLQDSYNDLYEDYQDLKEAIDPDAIPDTEASGEDSDDTASQNQTEDETTSGKSATGKSSTGKSGSSDNSSAATSKSAR